MEKRTFADAGNAVREVNGKQARAVVKCPCSDAGQRLWELDGEQLLGTEERAVVDGGSAVGDDDMGCIGAIAPMRAFDGWRW